MSSDILIASEINSSSSHINTIFNLPEGDFLRLSIFLVETAEEGEGKAVSPC